MSIPSPQALAVAGIVFLAAFAVWKAQIQPRWARRHAPSPT